MSMNVPGYNRVSLYNPQQTNLMQRFLDAAGANSSAAAEGYRQFLPGGSGGDAIRNQANQNFQQVTIPSILNTFGTNVKSSSALNQALAAGAANLNTDVSSQLAKLMLEASHGLGNLGIRQGQEGLQQQSAYAPKQNTLLEQFILSILGSLGGGVNAFSSGGGSALAKKAFGG